METNTVEHAAFFVEMARAVFQLAPVRLEALPESDPETGAAAWRVEGDSGPVAILRAYREGYAPPEDFHYFYPWACPSGRCDISGWLATRAATLLALETAGYPAPRVLRTHSGSPVGTFEGWHVLATGYIAGAVLRPSLDQLRQLGATLARLHSLQLDHAQAGLVPGFSYWAPRYAIPSARAKLTAVADLVPDETRQFYNGLRLAVEGIARRVEPSVKGGELAETVIHGDVWAANAIQTPLGTVALIDWDQGGRGLAVLDLARCLLECHLGADLPPEEPLAWHIQPEPARIAAAVDGYASVRTPTAAELDALLDAMCFGIAFIGALHFEQALLHPLDDSAWREGMQRRYERLRNRFDVSETVADLARARFRALAC